jgi:predicted dehydrogenase
MDVGIYCVQAVRYVTGQEPIAVTAQEGFRQHPEKFSTIEESITWQMEMPDGVVAKCTSSYSEQKNRLRIEARKAGRNWNRLTDTVESAARQRKAKCPFLKWASKPSKWTILPCA